MQSELTKHVSRDLHTTTDSEDHVDLHATQATKPDTRRFAHFFSCEVPEVVSVQCGDTTNQEHEDNSDVPSRWQNTTPDNDSFPCPAQGTLITGAEDSLVLSDAQQIVACYRAVHARDHESECTSTEINELSQDPDDQRSMYTISASVDPQSTMDMMWRPKPKVHMRRADRGALIQAQSQAIAMMHNAGLKPTSKVQCRRRGCADILSGVDALKYHLHIHNIADMASTYDDSSPPTTSGPSRQRSTSNFRKSKKTHSRSKLSLGAQQKSSITYPSSRKLSAGSLFPSHLSPLESTQEPRHNAPSLTTAAMSFVSDSSPCKFTSTPPVRIKNETPSTDPSAPRGRRGRKKSMASSAGADSPSIAMLLSPPSSPDVHGRFVFIPPTNFPSSFVANMHDGNIHYDVTSDEGAYGGSAKLVRSRSPLRALSPSRAMSPIRNGIKRVLSIGCSAESDE